MCGLGCGPYAYCTVRTIGGDLAPSLGVGKNFADQNLTFFRKKNSDCSERPGVYERLRVAKSTRNCRFRIVAKTVRVRGFELSGN